MAVILPYPDQLFVDGNSATSSRRQTTRQQTYRKFLQVHLRLELKERKMIKTIGFLSGLLVMSVASSAFATTVKQEPPMGAMREGKSCSWTRENGSPRSLRAGAITSAQHWGASVAKSSRPISATCD